jgi:hypothetical protein
MEKLYDYILAGIKKSPDLYQAENYQDFETYLASLQEPAKYLWGLYQRSMVNVDYSDSEIQAVYLIRYYPHYVQKLTEWGKVALKVGHSRPTPSDLGY